MGRETSQCEVGRMICRSAEQQGKQIVCTSTLSTAHTDLKPLSTYLRKCNKMVELDITLPREKIKKQFLEQILKRENITIGVDEQELVIAKASTCSIIESVIKQAKLHCTLMKCEINTEILLKVFAERTR